MFCDLVDSTRLSSQLDPEDLREVVQAYQATAAAVIQRFDGHIAQYLGDGLLVYFSYPQAHEDDARRAVRTGLDLVEALGALNASLVPQHGVRLAGDISTRLLSFCSPYRSSGALTCLTGTPNIAPCTISPSVQRRL